ncbi:hypothetical protein AJ80_08489 [Polytolypa hystricis UAMH7299]|uniref:Tyrosine decarboxylase n=1 Tax=Polytolypa hystricis (strain UAMH7299) TaxID=1447883 RepID=A0A2B7X6R5_POLH7|nr:hypothetical protein AJ80_08489 [Polytolypa hystricis UAMH7299]
MDTISDKSIQEAGHELSKHLWDIALKPWDSTILPSVEQLSRARESLVSSLPEAGLGFDKTRNHLIDDIVPGLNASSISPNYYGFVTGGVTPAALLADNIVSAYDQNVQVHLPDHSVATDVEFYALGLLLDLFNLDRKVWVHATTTTGATASNILGLACGREYVLRNAVQRKGGELRSAGEHGVIEVMHAAGLKGLQVLSTLPHSSLGKAAGILGIGRANVKSIPAQGHPLIFDLQRLEEELARPDVASIVAMSYGEVNTGWFVTQGIEEAREIRRLCDMYGAWLHVDGAFGIFGRVLKDSPEFERIKKGCEGIELADSITGDAHKLLNVPYDCGFFFSRHANLAEDVFRNPNAAYLSGGSTTGVIPSPLNIGIENSRRFRELPVYASLVAYGRDGYRDMVERQTRLSRSIAGWVFDHPAYETLPSGQSRDELLENTFVIVLLRAKDEALNAELGKRINATEKVFVSGTSWEGQPACRIAISNWRVNEKQDFAIVKEVLEEVAK